MELKRTCERCRAALSDDGPAYLCSHECTFCATCYRQLHSTCPNCSGELVRRPRRGPFAPPIHLEGPVGEGSVSVRPAAIGDLGAAAPLFDAYRQFYEQPSDIAASRRFLEARLVARESSVWLAEEKGQAVGFMQLYPLFSSVSLGPIFVLNDLFVHPTARRRRVASRLLAAARAHGQASEAHYLELSTAVDNPAQRLYESHGWKLDREFLHYELPLRD
jgi:ribosomal protein S18 acetylase RimI-like enzyme